MEIEDENGNKVTYETDGNGRVTKIRDATGRYIEIVWGASGRISGARDQTNRTVSYGYSAEGMLTSVTDTAGRTTTYEYTPGRFGPQLSAVKDPWGRVLTSVTYDATGRVSSYTEHGETYTYTYRVDGLDKTKKTDSSGTETILEYTQTGQITRKTEAGSVTEETGYNPDGSVAWRYGAMRESSTNVHDGQGRLLRREEARGTPLQLGYDYTYDPVYPDKTKRILVTAEQNGARIPGWLGWEYEYEPSGSANPGALKAVKRIGTDGTIETLTTYETNSRGQVTKQTDASGGVTDYAFDTQGNLQSVTGPANNALGTRPATSYTYDGLGRVLTLTARQK